MRLNNWSIAASYDALKVILEKLEFAVRRLTEAAVLIELLDAITMN